MILDLVAGQPFRKLLYFPLGLLPQTMINNQRDDSSVAATQPKIQQQSQAKTVCPAGDTNSYPRIGLKRTKRANQLVKFTRVNRARRYGFLLGHSLTTRLRAFLLEPREYYRWCIGMIELQSRKGVASVGIFLHSSK